MRIPPKVADVVGVLALGLSAVGAAWIVARLYGTSTGIWAWCLGYPALAVSGLFVWHSKKWPRDVSDAIIWTVGSAVLGAMSFGVDLMVGTGAAPDAPIRYAVWNSRGPFGVVLTIALCPGLTLICLSGVVREFFLSEHQPVPPKTGRYVFLKLGK